jgi:beta-hydroxylase
MNSVTIILFLISAFILGSITYVYLYRGKARYENLGEYLRKGWPIFSPFNCLLYLFTQPRARHSIINLDKFPELDDIQKNWETIREEVINLYRQQYFEQTKKPESQASYDIGFRTFFKYGWSKFYLKWYGYTHDSAKKLCPKTVQILEKIPSVNGAMFSVLPVDGQLTRHLDPIACSLRYHLGLDTPNSDDCFINIDEVSYSWRNGKALLFDETYPHYARNDSDHYRLILMCDVERPMNFIGRFINFFFKGLMRMTVVPNIEGDKRGFANVLFSGLAPVNRKMKALKQSNRKLYLLIKYTINLTLILLAFAVIAGLLQLLYNLTMTLTA